jgi:hypothetical protein
MALKMAQPWKHPRTGVYWFRKAVPIALRHKIGKREILVSLKTKDPKEARAHFVRIAAEVQERWDALAVERPPLTKKQIAGLAGEFYRWVVAEHDEDPGAPQRWLDELAEIDRVTGRLPNRPPRTMTVYLEKCANLSPKGTSLSRRMIFGT